MKQIYVKEEWCLGCHLCKYLGFTNFEHLKKAATSAALSTEKRKKYFGGVI